MVSNQTPTSRHMGVTFSQSDAFTDSTLHGANSSYTGGDSSRGGGGATHDATALVSDLMQAFLDRIKTMGSREELEYMTTFAYDKSKEDDIVKRKQEKAENFCKEYFDGSCIEMNELSIPRSLDFGDYHELRVLCLRDNGMSVVDGAVLSQLSRLRVLDISHNAIEQIRGKPFPRSLRSLNLSYNLLRDTFFSPLIQNVVDLNLAGNQIKTLDILPKKVAKLNIAENKISAVVSLRVLALHKITSLTLTGNPIVENTNFLKATITSLFPSLEELDGTMLPRRVSSRLVHRASSTMSLSIQSQGESRGRTMMTQSYQKQLDKKRSDEFKLREDARKEKLRQYVNGFSDTTSKKKMSQQHVETTITRLFNGKHNSMAHQRGRTQRGSSADSAVSAKGEYVPKRNRTSLSPEKMREMTMRLYQGSHHRTHRGPPSAHPSSPRRSSPRAGPAAYAPQQTFSPTPRGRSQGGAPRDDAVRLGMPSSVSFSPTDRQVPDNNNDDIDMHVASAKPVDDIDDDSFMNRPPAFKKKEKKPLSAAAAAAAAAAKQHEEHIAGDFSKRIRQLLLQFTSAVASVQSKDVSEYILTKIHGIASDIDFYLKPYLSALEEMSIDSVLGIEESPGNFGFHQMTDDAKDAFCARWITSQVAACIRAAEAETSAAAAATGDQGEASEGGGGGGGGGAEDGSEDRGSFPFAECVHMTSSMLPFMKETPVTWLFCASVLRRVESKRHPGKKLAVYVYTPRPPSPDADADADAAAVVAVVADADVAVADVALVAVAGTGTDAVDADAAAGVDADADADADATATTDAVEEGEAQPAVSADADADADAAPAPAEEGPVVGVDSEAEADTADTADTAAAATAAAAAATAAAAAAATSTTSSSAASPAAGAATDAKAGNNLSINSELGSFDEPSKPEGEDRKRTLQHASPNAARIYDSGLPTPPDDHTLTAKKGIEIFERSSSNLSDHGTADKAADKPKATAPAPVPALAAAPTPAPAAAPAAGSGTTTPRDRDRDSMEQAYRRKSESQTSFIDDELNEIVGSPPIVPRRRSKSNTSLPNADMSPISEGNNSFTASGNTGKNNGGDNANAPVTSLKAMGDQFSPRQAAMEAAERPSSRNSAHSSVADDAAAGDVFSRMNNLKARMSGGGSSSATPHRSTDSHDDTRSLHSQDTSPRLPDRDQTDREVSVHLLSSSPVDIEVDKQGQIQGQGQAPSPDVSEQTEVSGVTEKSEREMTAVERLKARLAKKNASDKTLTALDAVAPPAVAPPAPVAVKAKSPTKGPRV
jgi:hypothetical protein